MAQKVEYELSLKDLLSGKLREADSAAKGLENTIRNIATAVGIGFGVSKIIDFGKSIIDVGSKVENATTGLTTLLGDSAKAAQVVNDTMADAMATPFSFESLLSANKALISAGVSAQGARQDVLNLSNAIAATGGGDDELQRMVVNLQQIKNVGQASALDIKQFAYAGVNIYKVLEAAGIKVEKGNNDIKISYEQITTALQKAHEAGGIYYNGLENMSGNTSVQVSNLGDMMFQLKNQMFQDLKPAITAIIEGLSDLIKWLRDGWNWLVKNKESIKSLAIGFALAFGPILAFKGLMIAVNIVLRSGIMLVVTAIGFLISGFIDLYREGGPFKDFCDGLIEGFKSVYNFITDMVDGVIDLKNTIVDFFDTISPFTRSDGSKAPLFGAEDIPQSVKDLLKEKESPMASLEERRAYENFLGMKNGMFYDPSDPANSMGLKGVKEAAKNKIPKDDKGSKERNKRDVSAKGAVGNRSVTINIKMDNLVKEFKVITTNIKESPEKILELLKPAFTSVINDSQIIGNR